MNISIRRALPGDAPALTTFAAASFRAAFGAHNTPADMDRYIGEHFTLERQAAEIGDPSGVVLLAEGSVGREASVLAGYARLVRGPAPSAAAGRAIELRRLYVDARHHGTGVAQRLMAAALDVATADGAQHIWLAVWERNARAISFYEKCGFVRVGSKLFVLGADEQTDLVMTRRI